MRQSILTDQQAQFLREEKESLAGIQLALSDLDLPRESLYNLQKAILQLDELFLIVVAGEFNAGKSALLNALLGEKALLEGATPTTSRVTLVKWGEKPLETIVDEGFAVYSYPLPILKELNIVDTPGTNAVIRQHERLTDEFVPRSDLVLFATSSDRPMTESERQFLERILTWGKKVVFVLNKIDIFDDAASLDEVRDFVILHASTLLGGKPDLFPVSAKLAQRALSEPDPAKSQKLWLASRLGALESYINATLDDVTRLRLKFNNPLGVAENLIAQAEETIQFQEEILQEDKETVAALETAMNAYQHELENELTPRLAEVENILHKLENRGLDFFDNQLRLTNIKGLMSGAKVRSDFERDVLTEMPKQIEEQVQRLIDWLVQKDLHEWQQVMGYLQRRQAQHIDHLVGESYGPQETRRRELIDTVGQTVQTIVETYDHQKEASELASSVELAVAQTAVLEAGAVGLGAIVTFAVLSSAVDITGTLAAGTMAILGFFVIPFKRKQAKENFKEKMTTLRTKLLDALTTQFTNESVNAIDRMKNGVAPYTRYITSERERIEKTETTLGELKQKLSALRARSEAVLK
ncbi:MAG: GTP-binding protein [Anaerolineae bacterium]|nr:GTP-binding protein [Anaerolineae bacterium]MBT7991546.1 GTP-binding protein [Anaerolineae bacterium]